MGIYQEHGQAFIAQATVHRGDHTHKIGIAGVGDKAFAPIENILTAIGSLFRSRAAGAGIRSGIRLGERKGCKAATLFGPSGVTARLIAHQSLHAPPFLLFRSSNKDGLDAQIIGAAGQAEAGIAIHQLFADPGPSHGAHALPAILCGQVGANQAHFKGFVISIPVQLAGSVILSGFRTDLFEHELMDHGHDVLFFFSHNETGSVQIKHSIFLPLIIFPFGTVVYVEYLVRQSRAEACTPRPAALLSILSLFIISVSNRLAHGFQHKKHSFIFR